MGISVHCNSCVKMVVQKLLLLTLLGFAWGQSDFDCSVCWDCPPPLTGLSALLAGGSCKQRCDLCGFCNLYRNIGQCKFCIKGRGDPSGSKACRRKCERGEPLCKGPYKTKC